MDRPEKMQVQFRLMGTVGSHRPRQEVTGKQY